MQSGRPRPFPLLQGDVVREVSQGFVAHAPNHMCEDGDKGQGQARQWLDIHTQSFEKRKIARLIRRHIHRPLPVAVLRIVRS
ncbi:hypothetical protein FACS1894124_7710 [Spirochaetia bacterium]|nr:hypothetical protein FACS1894124_7710 [Spirochaetia bacterium]